MSKKEVLKTGNIKITRFLKPIKILILMIWLISCTEGPTKPQTEPANLKTETIKNNTDSNTNNEPFTNTLKTKKPLNKEELENIIPLEINELKLNETKFIDQMQMIQATYENNFTLTIQDFAGTNGSAIKHFYQSFENKTGSSQIYKERDGFKTTSIYKYNNTELSYVYLDRFFITLDAKKLNPDQLWKFFDPNSLSSLEILNQ